jgi:hypothetical protein
MPEGCVWLQWSDIDFGGFSMLDRLRREIDADIKPFRMNERELAQYSHLTASITDYYAQKLSQLIHKPELQDCKGCIEYMLNNKVRLEQESMLTESVTTI